MKNNKNSKNKYSKNEHFRKNKSKKSEKILKIEHMLNKKSSFKIYEIVLLSTLIVIASSFLTALILQGRLNNSSSIIGKSSNNEYLEEFEEVYTLINDSYYEKVDNEKLINGAIDGMLESLGDPHTSYFNVSETENFNEVMNGSYKGIGVEISLDSDGNVIIFSVFKNSPASEAGLKFNDIILEVNGKSVKSMTTTEVVALIKDEKKPKASIKIKRNDKEITYEVEKRVVVIESVESKIYNSNKKKIGYLLINNFADNTYEQFKEKLEKLESKDISGLVIDVRGNSGGYLHSVSSMLDMFLSKGKVSYQIADKNKVTKYVSKTTESRNYPIAVLTDQASASASEILAIGLKESYNADVIGTTTYGKGTVQITKDLKGGSMIKYTVQKWLSPNGNWVNEKGVKPTYEVEMKEEYSNVPTDENDNQLQTAIKVVSEK